MQLQQAPRQRSCSCSTACPPLPPVPSRLPRQRPAPARTFSNPRPVTAAARLPAATPPSRSSARAGSGAPSGPCAVTASPVSSTRPSAASVSAKATGLLAQSMPQVWATDTAVRAWSPVTMTVRMPASCSWPTTAAVSPRSGFTITASPQNCRPASSSSCARSGAGRRVRCGEPSRDRARRQQQLLSCLSAASAALLSEPAPASARPQRPHLAHGLHLALRQALQRAAGQAQHAQPLPRVPPQLRVKVGRHGAGGCAGVKWWGRWGGGVRVEV